MSRQILVLENITTKALLAYVLHLGLGPDRSGNLDICNSMLRIANRSRYLQSMMPMLTLAMMMIMEMMFYTSC